MEQRKSYEKAHALIEHIFCDVLPENGLVVREAQIALCHEMLDALMLNRIALCDTGVGIGKTHAYLGSMPVVANLSSRTSAVHGDYLNLQCGAAECDCKGVPSIFVACAAENGSHRQADPCSCAERKRALCMRSAAVGAVGADTEQDTGRQPAKSGAPSVGKDIRLGRGCGHFRI